MNEHERTRIANELKEAAENIKEIQNRGFDFDLEISEQLANELLEIERILGWDADQPNNYTFTKLAELIDPICHVKEYDITPRGADECDMEWEWRCTNCHINLSYKFDDLDIKTPEEIGLFYCPNCGHRIIDKEQ